MRNSLRGSKRNDNEPIKPPEGTDTGFRSGFVGLIGKPNVGKSTILNTILKKKISIVSPKPQTTRHRILGILTRPDAQVMFVDSPGWHKAQHALGHHLLSVTQDIIEDADLLVVIVDASTGLTREDQWVFDKVRQSRHRSILAINKVDRVNKTSLLPMIEQCAAMKLFEDYIPISAVTGDNLGVLVSRIVALLPEGPRWYEPGQETDQPTEQLIGEFIREQVLLATRQEVPHAVAVVVEEVSTTPSLIHARATILVEREGQKAILIGQKGQMLKRIGQAARLDLERYFGQKMFLELWVKVAQDWRADPSKLRQLGYGG